MSVATKEYSIAMYVAVDTAAQLIPYVDGKEVIVVSQQDPKNATVMQ